MTHEGRFRLMQKILILTGCLLLTHGLFSQPETVVFRTSDKVPITADLYMTGNAKAPFILLFHQAKYSRGEYVETAPKLNKLGFNCLAVDLRSGGDINTVPNLTFNYADSVGLETRYIDAYQDMRTAVSYVKRHYPGVKIILLGSSYSASLSLKLASDYPDGISGVVAFSPGEYFSKFGWNPRIIEISVARIQCPVFITSAKDEKAQWEKIYDAIPLKSKVAYLPQSDGKHGSKVLWPAFPEHTEYWNALTDFLNRFK